MTSLLSGRIDGADPHPADHSRDHQHREPYWAADSPPEDAETPAAAVDFAVVRRIQDEVNAQLDSYGQDDGPGLDRSEQRQLALGLIADRTAAWADAETAAGNPPTVETETALAEAVLAAMFGLGRIEQLLRDDDVEEIFINGAAPAIKRFADGHSETVAPVAESDTDLLEQLRSIATYHGQNERAVTTAWPFLNLRLPDGSRLAAQW